MHHAPTAYERVLREYAERPGLMPLAWYEEQFKLHGFLFVRPDVYLAIKPVVSTAPEECIKAADYVFKSAECDCWYVGILAGNMARAWEFMPWALPKMCFQRAKDATGKLKFYSTNRLIRLVKPEILIMP